MGEMNSCSTYKKFITLVNNKSNYSINLSDRMIQLHQHNFLNSKPSIKWLLPIYSLLMIVRLVMSWKPDLDVKKFPWSIVFNSTEPFLAATRKIVPPLAGVDISPVIWLATISFFSEIIISQQ